MVKKAVKKVENKPAAKTKKTVKPATNKSLQKVAKPIVKKVQKAKTAVKKAVKKTEKKIIPAVKAKKTAVKKAVKKIVNKIKPAVRKSEKAKAVKKAEKVIKKAVKEVKQTVNKAVKKVEKKSVSKPVQKTLRPATKTAAKPDSEVLTQAEIKEIETHLLEMKKEVQERIKSKKEAEMPDTEVGDEADVASQNLDREVLFELNGNAQVLLDQIESALRRISKGIYGTCEYCRCQIPKQRILAVPFARYCIKCQSSNEKRR